jgi:hypothetical protein
MEINFESFDAISKLKARDWRELTPKPLPVEPRDPKANWYSEVHDGPCCSGCIGEWEDGYSGGGYYCCCNDEKTLLENQDYDPLYPPVNGKIPEEFQYFGYRTAKRWIERFKNELLPEELENYYKWNLP